MVMTNASKRSAATCPRCGRTDVPLRLTGPAGEQWLVLAQHRQVRLDPNSRHCAGYGLTPAEGK
jgi:hypothetical protein